MAELERKILVADPDPELRNTIQEALYNHFGNNMLTVEQAPTGTVFSSKYNLSFDVTIIGSGFSDLVSTNVIENFSMTTSYRPCIFLPDQSATQRYARALRQLPKHLCLLTKPSHSDINKSPGFYTALINHVFDFLTATEKLEQTNALGIIGSGRTGVAYALSHLKSVPTNYVLINNSDLGAQRHREYFARRAKDSLESVLHTAEVLEENRNCKILVADYKQINLLCKDIFFCWTTSSEKEAELIDREKFLDLNFDEMAFVIAPHFTNRNANYYVVTNPSDMMAQTFDIYTRREEKNRYLKIEAVGIDMEHKRGLAWMEHTARSDKTGKLFNPEWEQKPSIDLVIAGPHSEHFVIIRDNIKGSPLDYWGRVLGTDAISREALVDEINRRGRGNYAMTNGAIIGGEVSAVLLDHLRSKNDPQAPLYGSLLVDLLNFSDLGAGFYDVNSGGRRKGESLIAEKFPRGIYTGWLMKHDQFSRRPVPLRLEIGDAETRQNLVAALLRERQIYTSFARQRLRETENELYKKALDFFGAPY